MYYGYNDSRVIPYPNVRYTQPVTFDVLVAPTELPITLTQVKEQLRLDESNTSQDDYLTLLIEASRGCFESYTGRILINTGFRTYFDYFKQSLELAKSKLQSLDAFQYSVDGGFTAIDTDIYYVTSESIYSRIIISEIENIPTDKDDIFQSIRVDFTAGYGDSQDDIKSDIKMALLQQVTDLYENRGDCSACDCEQMESWSAYTRMVYNKYMIKRLYGGPYRG